MRLHIIVLCAGLVLSLPAAADDMGSMSMPMSGSPSQEQSPAAKAFSAANDKMMKDMNVPLTEDADRDFVTSMIPHHQGAIDMAKAELSYGKDAELRKLASGIIEAQEREIAEMKAWLAAHPK